MAEVEKNCQDNKEPIPVYSRECGCKIFESECLLKRFNCEFYSPGKTILTKFMNFLTNISNIFVLQNSFMLMVQPSVMIAFMLSFSLKSVTNEVHYKY